MFLLGKILTDYLFDFLGRSIKEATTLNILNRVVASSETSMVLYRTVSTPKPCYGSIWNYYDKRVRWYSNEGGNNPPYR